MKKVLLVASMTLFVVGAAVAADGEATYKSTCAACHGADGAKSAGGTTPVKDLDEDTILTRLQGYADGSYGGSQKAVMQNMAKRYSADELKALAEYAGKL